MTSWCRLQHCWDAPASNICACTAQQKSAKLLSLTVLSTLPQLSSAKAKRMATTVWAAEGRQWSLLLPPTSPITCSVGMRGCRTTGMQPKIIFASAPWPQLTIHVVAQEVRRAELGEAGRGAPNFQVLTGNLAHPVLPKSIPFARWVRMLGNKGGKFIRGC